MASCSTDTYKLRCTLLGHSMDVRGVTCGVADGGKEYILSGSRDKTAKVWLPSDDGIGFDEFQKFEGHTNFVSCVCAVPPSEKYPKGIILSGGHDHTILGFEVGNPTPVFHLIGHKGTVCSIDASGDSLLVSGSWDQSAKVWLNMENVATLIGHAAAVWAVAFVPGESRRILTGSADKEIRLWADSQLLIVYKGHTDCVRALAVVSQDQFLSASNDASIRLWSIPHGETLKTFYGHSNFIYSISLLPSGQGFVSVGEDRTLRVWKNEEECKQVIFLPATSIWSVATMQNGDIVAGSSDGTLRVFTSDPSRMGSQEAQQAFEDEVSKTTIAAQQDLGGMKISELPGPESLLREGRKDGETKMVREGDKVSCYSWSAAELKWNKIGDVVGASGATQNTSGKVLYEGKEYDYVFTVDLDDQGTLKLPYNISEDPWFAAQKFIHKNNLSQLFLDQVANFIVNNTKGMQLGTPASSDFADPFTGGGRYVPGTGSSTSTGFGNGGAADPFTGSGAYTTQSAQATSAPQIVPPSDPLFPVKEFLRFGATPNYEALSKKLNEFIQSLGPSAGIPTDKVDILLNIGKSPQWTDETTSLVGTCLQWPSDKVFPVLDLLRLGALNPAFAQKLNENFPLAATLATKYLSKDAPTNQMLFLRLLNNVFGSLTGELMKNRSVIVSSVLNNMPKAKMNEVAASTLLLNYSIVVRDPNNVEWGNVESQTEVLMSAISMLEVLDDGEAVFRTLVAVGNIIAGNSTMGNLFRSLSGDTFVDKFMKSGSLPKIQQCATQIKQCL